MTSKNALSLKSQISLILWWDDQQGYLITHITRGRGLDPTVSATITPQMGQPLTQKAATAPSGRRTP